MTWETAELLMDLLEADGRFAPFLTTDGTEYERPSQRAANAVAGGGAAAAVHPRQFRRRPQLCGPLSVTPCRRAVHTTPRAWPLPR